MLHLFYIYASLEDLQSFDFETSIITDCEVNAIDKIIKYGGAVDNKYPGIYYVSGLVNIPSQIIVQSELDSDLHATLKILSNDAKKEDI